MDLGELMLSAPLIRLLALGAMLASAALTAADRLTLGRPTNRPAAPHATKPEAARATAVISSPIVEEYRRALADMNPKSLDALALNVLNEACRSRLSFS